MSFFRVPPPGLAPTPLECMVSGSPSLDPSGHTLASLKHALTALPSGLLMPNDRVRDRKPKSARLKRDSSSSSVFDVAGVHRPFPKLTTLTPTVRTTLQYTANFFSSSTSTPVYAATSFALTAFDNYAEYTGLFDQYMIEHAECWIEPSNIGTSTSFVPWSSAVDLDDANVPTTAVTVQGKPQALTSMSNAGHYHRWVPHMAVAAFSGAFTSYTNSPPQWLDSGSPNVAHYGLKTATFGADGVIRYFIITVRAVVAFRAPNI